MVLMFLNQMSYHTFFVKVTGSSQWAHLTICFQSHFSRTSKLKLTQHKAGRGVNVHTKNHYGTHTVAALSW